MSEPDYYDIGQNIAETLCKAGDPLSVDQTALLTFAMSPYLLQRDARIAELERESQSMRADWKAICDAAESMPAGTVEFQLRQRIAELERENSELKRQVQEWKDWLAGACI